MKLIRIERGFYRSEDGTITVIRLLRARPWFATWPNGGRKSFDTLEQARAHLSKLLPA